MPPGAMDPSMPPPSPDPMAGGAPSPDAPPEGSMDPSGSTSPLPNADTGQTVDVNQANIVLDIVGKLSKVKN